MRIRALSTASRTVLAAVLVCTLVPLGPGTALATLPTPKTIRVNASTGSDITGSGTLASPYATIGHAVSMAIAGDTVRVAPGTYYPPATISVPSGVRLIGAGLGRTVVVGVGGPTGPIFTLLNCNSETLIEGFVIRGGGGSSGGAMLITDGEPVIQRNDFNDNGVSDYGGAIYMYLNSGPTCAPLIFNNTFSGNEAGDQGGAIYAHNADPYIYRCTFRSNAASGVAPLGGGGAVYIHEGEAQIQRCVFENNHSPNGHGGALTVQESMGLVDIRETLFDGNIAGEYGGAVWGYANLYQLNVLNCRFENNSASSYGGGIRLYNAAAIINGCSFTNNVANGGVTAGGLDIYDAGADQPATVDSCIFHSNGADDITNPSSFCDVTVTYSCLDYPQVGTGNIVADPLLMGSTWAARLWDTSPCIDTGNPASTLDIDWEVLTRPKDGDGDDVARVDMGSYEYGTTVGRLSGNDRFATACEAVQDRSAESPVAIIATGRDFPDALCAAGLAGAYKAPVLLTEKDTVPDSLRARLLGLQTREAIVVGGTGVVSDHVVDTLTAMGIDVQRVAGSDRYATSRAVADHLADMGHTEYCWVARGDDFPDALALAPLATQFTGPVLLTRTDSLPTATLGALQAYDYDYALVAGGTSAVSPGVYGAIMSEIPAEQIWRASGATRYETAAAVAKWAWDMDLSNGEFVGLATGADFPDALAGGAACGYERGVLLLTTKDALHPAAADYLDDRLPVRREVWAFGGTGVIDDAVLEDCRALLP
ncbi:MAG: cell wall-binding repeat-containing protein [Coriobacteriia bacterium]